MLLKFSFLKIFLFTNRKLVIDVYRCFYFEFNLMRLYVFYHDKELYFYLFSEVSLIRPFLKISNHTQEYRL